MSIFVAIWRQAFPPTPVFTDKDIPSGSQVGKVFIVTGANSGVGLELCKQLYKSGATIYMAGRSPARLETAIQQVKESASPPPEHPATLKPLLIDLSDLTTVKPALDAFAAQETRLDIIWNNAGAGLPPGSLTKQGIEAHIGTNCVAPFMFTRGLLPFLQAAARTSPKDSVRVVWTSSVQIELMSPPGGVNFAALEQPTTMTYMDYGASKVGNWFLATECARRWGKDGIISVSANPGNLNTPMFDTENWLAVAIFKILFLHPVRYGAYTNLYSGLSPEVNESRNGGYIWPWGREGLPERPDVIQAIADGKAKEFWEWCEKKCERHV
jgi:NAD(P)-dependent dehydrogenase (short-subunit alcohol dehydrogenase family)